MKWTQVEPVFAKTKSKMLGSSSGIWFALAIACATWEAAAAAVTTATTASSLEHRDHPDASPKRHGDECVFNGVDDDEDECSAQNRSLRCWHGKCACVPSRIWNGAKCQNRGYGSWCTETKDCYIDDGHAPADRKKDSGLVCDRYKLCRCKNARPYWNGTSCSTSPCYSDGDCSYGHICFQFGRTCIKKADKRAAEESINWIAANMESLLKMHGLNGSHESPTRTQTRASRREFDLYSIYFVLGFVVVLLIVVMAARVYSTRPRNHDPVTINSTSRAARELPGRNFIPAESRLLGREVRDSDSSSAFIRELLDECQRQLVDDRAAAGAKRTVSGELPSYDEATAPPTYNNAVQGLDESTNCDVQPARHKDN